MLLGSSSCVLLAATCRSVELLGSSQAGRMLQLVGELGSKPQTSLFHVLQIPAVVLLDIKNNKLLPFLFLANLRFAFNIDSHVTICEGRGIRSWQRRAAVCLDSG